MKRAVILWGLLLGGCGTLDGLGRDAKSVENDVAIAELFSQLAVVYVEGAIEIFRCGPGGWGECDSHPITLSWNNLLDAENVSGCRGDAMGIADLNGDGKLEFAVPDGSTGLIVYLANGHGSFNAVASYEAHGTPVRIAAGDIDKDGNVDLVAGDDTGHVVAILFNRGDGTFADTPTK